MAMFNRDNQDYGYRRFGNSYRGYDRDMGNRDTGNRGAFGGQSGSYGNAGYDRNYGRNMGGGNMGNMNRGGYDRDYGYGATGYDRNYKSRQQTDYGDPFADRQNNTPIRVMRGDQDRDFGMNRDRGYDRNYSARDNSDRDGYSENPMGYDPYYSDADRMNRGGGYRNNTFGRGYNNDRY